MPRSYRALPLPSDPRRLVKAPTYDAFLDQEFDAENFRLPRIPSKQSDIACAMMDAIDDIREMGQGEKYTVYRYPIGLAVETPSGWTVMTPFDIPKDKAIKPVQKAAATINPGRRGPKGSAT